LFLILLFSQALARETGARGFTRSGLDEWRLCLSRMLRTSRLPVNNKRSLVGQYNPNVLKQISNREAGSKILVIIGSVQFPSAA
jgi:hypothetical protein